MANIVILTMTLTCYYRHWWRILGTTWEEQLCPYPTVACVPLQCDLCFQAAEPTLKACGDPGESQSQSIKIFRLILFAYRSITSPWILIVDVSKVSRKLVRKNVLRILPDAQVGSIAL